MVDYGRQVARALVIENPDWTQLEPNSMAQWLASIVTKWDALTPAYENIPTT